MKKAILILLVFGKLFWGCAPLPSTTLKTEMSSFKKEGMIAATLSLEDKRMMSEYTLKYEQINGTGSKSLFVDQLNLKKNDFVYNNGQVKFGYSAGDFKEGNKDVYLFNIIKPAGKYRIYELDIFHNSGSQLNQYNYKVPLDITFEIVEGKISYLGEINIFIKDKITKLINSIERDRVKFREINPNIIF
ncbi:hypothetical protein [Flavobacterium sp. N1994]|uniref:hypothetical protein n=1 Tax=Flavobacterium sp. N1994 TaxID=2986827 RepID=UPI002221D318|nr:hypothetical protein [Flavobacterium sp. N1994]